jgi:hypothetical protein
VEVALLLGVFINTVSSSGPAVLVHKQTNKGPICGIKHSSPWATVCVPCLAKIFHLFFCCVLASLIYHGLCSGPSAVFEDAGGQVPGST